jgi:hypothetical protein
MESGSNDGRDAARLQLEWCVTKHARDWVITVTGEQVLYDYTVELYSAGIRLNSLSASRKLASLIFDSQNVYID